MAAVANDRIWVVCCRARIPHRGTFRSILRGALSGRSTANNRHSANASLGRITTVNGPTSGLPLRGLNRLKLYIR